MHLDVMNILTGEYTPASAAFALAEFISSGGVPLHEVTLDLRRAPAALHVSSFVNPLLYKLEELGHPLYEATSIEWQCKYASESRRMRALVAKVVERRAKRNAPSNQRLAVAG